MADREKQGLNTKLSRRQLLSGAGLAGANAFVSTDIPHAEAANRALRPGAMPQGEHQITLRVNGKLLHIQ
ncbi:MAG TPA: hypothetical protein VGS41_11985, partial [Chthonomonadales bacterium]|nr:hypothetical protein [Chthonomonadales bacterium]